jgi:hypothetical protein
VTENKTAKTGQFPGQPQLHSPDQTVAEAPVAPPVQTPTLSRFYVDPKMKAASFLKAVRTAKVKTFQSEDIASAQAMLAEKDSSLSRTLSLGTASRPPDVLERWVCEIVKSSLEPEIMADQAASAEAIFERVVRSQANELQSKSKALRLRAQNLIKLTLLWLVWARSLDPLQALYTFAEISNKRVGRENVRSEVQKILLQAKPGQWKSLFAVARLSSDVVQRANLTATDALRERDRLQERVAQLEHALEQKGEEADNLSSALEHTRSEVASGKKALEDERKLRDLDLAQATGRTRHFLTGRLSLLLSDARVALEFEPPQIEAARQRLDSAKETIAEEVKNSHD